MHQITKILSRWYYAFYVLIVAAAAGMWYVFNYKQLLEPIDPMSGMGMAIQYFVIIYVMASVPGSLFGFKLLMDYKVKKIADEQVRFQAYKNWAVVRLVLIGCGAVFGIMALYALHYQSMLWCAAISLIAIYFCKPAERKMELELLDENAPID